MISKVNMIMMMEGLAATHGNCIMKITVKSLEVGWRERII